MDLFHSLISKVRGGRRRRRRRRRRGRQRGAEVGEEKPLA
jgi:hypothetical protein